MCMTPEARRWLEIILVLAGAGLSGVAAYYNMDARVLLVEQQVKVESASRISGQAEIRGRLDKVDDRMDKVLDKMDTIKEAIHEQRTKR